MNANLCTRAFKALCRFPLRITSASTKWIYLQWRENSLWNEKWNKKCKISIPLYLKEQVRQWQAFLQITIIDNFTKLNERWRLTHGPVSHRYDYNKTNIRGNTRALASFRRLYLLPFYFTCSQYFFGIWVRLSVFFYIFHCALKEEYYKTKTKLREEELPSSEKHYKFSPYSKIKQRIAYVFMKTFHSGVLLIPTNLIDALFRILLTVLYCKEKYVFFIKREHIKTLKSGKADHKMQFIAS